jgi:hypothetical protein
MSSKRCPKCGFVSFAAAGACRRCGAALSVSPGAGASPLPLRQQTTRKKVPPLLVYIIGGVISLILGAFVFGVTADYGSVVPLGLFAVVLIGGMVVSFIIASHLKRSSAGESQGQSSTGGKYLKVVVYMLAAFILCLPFLLLNLNSNLSEEAIAGKIGELMGTCLFPAVITAVWMRYSRQEWSWPGVGLRYIALFLLVGIIFVMRLLADK